MSAGGARILIILTTLAATCTSSAHHGWDDYHYKKPLPSEVMVDVINNLGLALLEVHNEQNHNNIAISPYGATTVLVALLEGVTGNAAQEIIYAADLPHDYAVMRVGLRDIHRHLKSYFIPKEGFLAGLTLNHENITLRRDYEEILRFYGYDLESFNNPAYPETTTPIATTTTKDKTTTTDMLETTTIPATTQEITEKIDTTTTVPTTTITMKAEPTTVTEITSTTFKQETANTENVERTTRMDDISTTIKSSTDDIKESSTTQETTTDAQSSTQANDVITTLKSTVDPKQKYTKVEDTTIQITTENDIGTTKSEKTEGTTVEDDVTTTTISSSTGRMEKYTDVKDVVKEEFTEAESSYSTQNKFVTSTFNANGGSTTNANPTKFDLLSTMFFDSDEDEDLATTESKITVNIKETTMTLLNLDATTTSNNDIITDVNGQDVMKATSTNLADVTTEQQKEIITENYFTEKNITNEIEQTTIVTTETAAATDLTPNPSNDKTTVNNIEQTTIVTTEFTKKKLDTDLILNDMDLQNRPTRQDDVTESAPSPYAIGSTESSQLDAVSEDNYEYDYMTSEFPYSTAFSGTDLKMDYYTLSHASVSEDTDYEESSSQSTEIGVSETTERNKRESDFFATISAYIRPEVINSTKRSRGTRSVIDYIIARYYDTYQVNNDRKYVPRPHYSSYQPELPHTFLVNGNIREPNISFMTYDTVLPFRYLPELDAMALSFPLDSNMYYLLLVLPVEDDGIDKLIYKFRKFTSLKNVIESLKYTHVKAIIPSFMLKGYVVLTPTLQKLGVRKIFEPRHADFSLLTKDRNIYVTNIEQAVTVTIRNYMDNPNGARKLHEFRPVEFRADHPFLYFVMDSQLHVNLMAGKIVNPLNSRIK
ncbi:PREDICTED: location of vulva defective 1 [Nicrophorus vespilloides]|uniref:Location of vulva defective 1 n=1 Tax=Nicrophorus vespilloides TaxID=110193 RepID=A0ABM1NHV2_NICVS|nr:PREDICTED: location of vulva defective 1 [Nicrophorus vespilloides]